MITEADVDKYLELGIRIKTHITAFAKECGISNCYGGNAYLDEISVWLAGGNSIPFPTAVLWDSDVRTVEIAKYKAANDSKTKELSEFKRLAAIYCPDCINLDSK